MCVKMRIRKARKEDISRIIKLDNLAQYDSKKKIFIKNSVLDKNCYVALDQGIPVGYAVLEYTFFEFGFVSMLYLLDKHRRKGIGRRLMEHLENKCKTDKLFTSTNKSNKPMQKLLKKMNYQRSGMVYNLDPGDPELFYFKKITDSRPSNLNFKH